MDGDMTQKSGGDGIPGPGRGFLSEGPSLFPQCGGWQTFSVKGRWLSTPGSEDYLFSVLSLRLYPCVANTETDDTEMNKHGQVPIQLFTKMGGRAGCLAHGPPLADSENQPGSISIPCMIALGKTKRN